MEPGLASKRGGRAPRGARAAAIAGLAFVLVLGAVALGATIGRLADPAMKPAPRENRFGGGAALPAPPRPDLAEARPLSAPYAPPDSYPPSWVHDPAPAPRDDDAWALSEPLPPRAVSAAVEQADRVRVSSPDDAAALPQLPHYAALEAAGTGDAPPPLNQAP